MNNISEICNTYYKLASSMTKTDFKNLINDKDYGKDIIKFFKILELYQSNADYSPYKAALREAWGKLPEQLKSSISPAPKKINALYRGDDGKSTEPAISWSTNIGIAKLYGNFIYHFPKTIKSFSGILDIDKLVRIMPSGIEEKIGLERGIASDESEVIVFDPEWISSDDEAGAIKL